MLIEEKLKKLEDIQREFDLLVNERELAKTRTEKNITNINYYIDSYYFILLGSLLGFSINLLANVVHDYMSQFGIIYFIGTLMFLLLSIITLINFVVKKWKKTIKTDQLIQEILDDKDQTDFIKKANFLKNKIDGLRNQ